MTSTATREGDGLHGLHDFVLSRLDDRLQLAEESEDQLEHAFALTTRTFVRHLGHDIDHRPWAHTEIASFLLRTARRYRRHPDYNHAWDRF